MNEGEKYALFLGMLSGDGCLPISYNTQGYRQYPIKLVNTNKKIVELFRELFISLFNVPCKIYFCDRPNKKRLWEFSKVARNIYEKISSDGFPEGVKRIN